ncbi:MAG: hypothetical protein K9K81_11995 [Desulfobacteraceae bacterium]|nr:hypothetical protein [Desulfobacteraceae bacterium]
MIDIHSHILPGIDDGPSTLEESVEMGRLYAEAGFSRVVATPHWVPGTAWMPGRDAVERGVVALNAVLAKKQIGVRVYAGMEIAMDAGLGKLFVQGRLPGLAGSSYLLIEAPFQQMPAGWEQVFLKLKGKGCGVILAHPERCGQLAADPAMFDAVVEAGVFLQVNYDSFLGGYGRQAADTAFYLAGRGYAHCLATDSHDTAYRYPGRVQKAREAVEKAVGDEAADVMARVNPGRVLAGKGLHAPTPVTEKRRRKIPWWRRVMGYGG